jgi:hypothetical protein
LGDANAQISPLDISISPFSVTGLPLADFGYQGHGPGCYYSSSGIEPPLDSGDANEPSADRSTFDLSGGTSCFATAFSQPTSYASLDYNNFNHSSLTTSSSGDVSEVEEFGPLSVMNLSKPDLYDIGSLSDGSEPGVYCITVPPSYTGRPETQILSPDNVESIDLETFLKPTATTPMAPPQLQLTIAADPGPYSVPQNLSLQPEHGFTPIDDNTSPQSLGPPVTPASNEPMLLSTPFGYTTSLIGTGENPVLQFDPWSRERLLLARGELSTAS